MRVINIAPMGCKVYIYGPKEKAAYEKKTAGLDDNVLGQVSGNMAWVSGVRHCQHEAVHLVDWILEDHLEIEPQKLASTGELRAYMVEWLTGKMEKYIAEEV